MTGRERNYVASTDALTTDHGYHVLNAIYYHASEALYDLHRVVIESGKIKTGNFLKALDDIQEGSVDIVNISAGIHHQDCKQQCRVCKAAEEVVNSGTILVAGAGNNLDDSSKSMFCPALSDKTISVGSFEGICGFSVDGPGSGWGHGPTSNDLKPPGSYWVQDDETAFEWEPTDVPYCSLGGCTPEEDCENHRVERIPERNISFTHGEPDVFAPDQIVYRRPSGTAGIQTGSSFATALVSGALADLLSTVAKQRPLPQPHEVNEAVKRLSTAVADTPHRKFDAMELYEELL